MNKDLLNAGQKFGTIIIPPNVEILLNTTGPQDHWSHEIQFVLKMLIKHPPIIACPCKKGRLHWHIEREYLRNGQHHDDGEYTNLIKICCLHCGRSTEMNGPARICLRRMEENSKKGLQEWTAVVTKFFHEKLQKELPKPKRRKKQII